MAELFKFRCELTINALSISGFGLVTFGHIQVAFLQIYKNTNNTKSINTNVFCIMLASLGGAVVRHSLTT